MKTHSSSSRLSYFCRPAVSKCIQMLVLSISIALSVSHAFAQTTNAFDQGSNYAVNTDFNGLNNGSGFGAWSVVLSGSGGSIITNNGPNGTSFDIWNTGGSGSTIATRSFNVALTSGESFIFSLRLNILNGSDTNFIALQDAGGNILFSYWHQGGDNLNGWFSDANHRAGVATNFPYAYKTFQTFKFTLASATTYIFTDLSSGVSFSGVIANTPITQFSLIRRNGTTAPGNGEDFQFDKFIVTSAAPPTFQASPAPGALSIATNATIKVSITTGGVLLNTGSVVLKLDGNTVSPTVTGNSSLINVSYTPTSALASGSTHTAQIVIQDNNAASYTNTWSFMTGYDSLPVTLAGPFATGGGNDLTIFTAAGDAWLGANYDNNSSRFLYTRFSMAFNNLNGETGTGGGYGGLHFFNGTTEQLLVGNNYPSLNWGLDAAGSQQDLPGPIPINLGEWHTIVVRTQYVPGGNDNVTIYFDPDFKQTEDNQTGSIYNLSCDATTDNIRLRCGNGTANATWTNIVVASTSGGVGFQVAGPPLFQNLSPANGSFSATTNTAISAQVVVGGNPIISVSLMVDGIAVATTTNLAPGLVNVSGLPSPALSTGSIHNIQLVVIDSTGSHYTNAWSFMTGYLSLPVAVPGPITGIFSVNGPAGITIFSSAGDSWIGTNYNNGSNKTLYTRYSMTFNDLNGEIGGGGGYGGLHFELGNAEKLIVGNNWTSLNWSLESGGNTPTLDQDLNVAGSTLPVNVGVDEWHTIVVRTDFAPGINDNVTIYFDPDFTQTEAAQNPANVTTLTGDMSFDNIRLRVGNGTASATWSNIVVSAVSPFGASASSSILSIHGTQVSWTGVGILQQAPVLTGPWTDVGTDNPMTIIETNAAMFYRVRQ